eukprot:Nitzschia sp. Nitz4//scaffold45_size130396//31335//32001//NITZ4_003438-RA/size130396-processed-gene-0.212-mRNA-1//-1//CDS//3329552365//73//frame0
MKSVISILALKLFPLLVTMGATNGFALLPLWTRTSSSPYVTQRNAVRLVRGADDFDKAVRESQDSSLVVVDYSTSWCGPCRVIARTYEEISEKYPDAAFFKVIGDTSDDTTELMLREDVQSVPAFHYFKRGLKVDEVVGAQPEAIEAAISKHLPQKLQS